MTNFKVERENRNGAADKDSGTGESQKPLSSVRPSTAQMLHLLIDDPHWLARLAKTNADLLRYQALLAQWQAEGCPDLGPLPEAETPKPLLRVP
jgi:hypothetical protein